MSNLKLVKTAHGIDKFLKILQGFLFVLCMAAVVFIPVALIFKEKFIANLSTQILD
ncbi:hypothetical protein [Lutispora thermophila]|uniref:hypothetical protein n=1 Tax=Lutispora thermophila TaxID=288966 RepID=UPI001587AFC1|nr:hypothetical protein [Lutispora thermophila]